MGIASHRITFRLERSPSHLSKTIWANGGCLGDLMVRNEEEDILHALATTLKSNGATPLAGAK